MLHSFDSHTKLTGIPGFGVYVVQLLMRKYGFLLLVDPDSLPINV